MSYEESAVGYASANPQNPYDANPAKRQRPADGTFDPNRARKLDVGFQGAPAKFVGGTEPVERGGVLPPVTLGASSANYGDPLFMKLGDNAAKPEVHKVVNGMEVAAKRAYGNDAVMIMAALKAGIRPLGLAAEAVKSTPNNLTPSVTVKHAGLHSASVLSAKNGAREIYELRQFTASLDANMSTENNVNAEYQNSYGLVLTAYDERTMGNNFNKHASELVNNSLTWERAMGGYYGKARPWISAVMADFRHCLTSGILLVDRLLKAGVLQVAGQGGIASNAVAAKPGTVLRAPTELIGTVGVPAVLAPLPSYEVAARIANYMGLTTPSNPATDFLAPDASAFWASFTRTYADTLYYTANAMTGGSQDGTVNVAVEFGAEYSAAAQQPIFAGRFPDMKLKEDRIGAVVKFQANHCAQAVAAFAQAVEQVDQWTAGTAVSGAPGGIAVIMMHK